MKIICGVAHLDTWTILAFAQHTSNANFLASTPKTSNFSCIFETEGNKKYCGTKEFLLDGDFTQNKSSSRLFFFTSELKLERGDNFKKYINYKGEII